MALRDLAQEFQQALGNVGNAIGQGVQNVEGAIGQGAQDVEHLFTPQPPIQQPIPQNQSMVPPQQDFMSWLGNAAKTVENNVHFSPFGSNPVGIGPFSVGPQAPTPQDVKINVPQAIQNIPIVGPAANIGAGFAEGAINTVPHYLQGAQQLNAMVNGQAPVTPTSVVSNMAKEAELPLMFVGGGEEGLAAKELAANPSLDKFMLAGIQNIPKTAAIMGGFGATQGLEQSANNIPQQIEHGAVSGAENAAMGVPMAFLGPAAGYVGGKIGQIGASEVADQFANDIHTGDPAILNHSAIAPFKKALSLSSDPESQNFIADAADKVTSPTHMGDPEANHIVQEATNEFLPSAFQRLNTIQQSQTWLYLMDRMNGRIPDAVPSWMTKFDNAVFDTSGRKALQAGRINFGANIGGEEPSIKEELNQPPLPPKMSSKAIQDGVEAPRTGADVSVSPQAAIRYRIVKNAGDTPSGNPEPLPWETTQSTTENPFEGARSSLPPKEDQPVIKISNRENPVKVTNPNATVQDARRAMDTAHTQVIQRGRVVQQLIHSALDQGNKEGSENTPTNYGENRLFRQAIEHPEQEKEILPQVKNPTKFKQALDAYRDYTKYTLQAAKSAGAKLKGVPAYYSHIWDLSDPEKAAEFEQLAQAKAKNYKGWYNKPRVFNSIEEGEAKGFQLKNADVANDIADYTNAFAKEQGARALTNRLVADFPDKAVQVEGEGAPINSIQSRIPGAKGLYYTQDIADQLRDLESKEKTGLGIKVISGLNNLDKQVRLGGGLFHIQNTGLDYLASQIGFGRFPRIITAARSFLDPNFYIGYMKNAIEDGTIDKMAQANVSLDTEQDFTGKNPVVAKISKNPINWLNDATFKRLENFFKVEAFRALDKRGLIDTSNPEGIKVAQQYGRELNNMFGGQNRTVGDDIFKSAVGRFTSHFGFLAPDYQQGRFKHTFSAFGIGNGEGINPLKRSAGNNYAAYTLVLRVAITAMVAEAMRRALTGKFNSNLISVVQNDLLDPNFPTPWQNTSANGTKENEVAHMPASNLSDWYRMISDPQQFAISHLGAGLSDLTSFISNKDYFGNTISQTNNPIEKVGKIALNDSPIPFVQGMKVIQGREPIGNAIINELGDRVSLDPNDPTALYFNAQKQAFNNLISKVSDPKMVNDLNGAFTQLQNLSAMDPNNPNKKMLEYQIYSTFPQLYDVMKQSSIAQAGGDQSKIDPIYQDKYQSIVPYFLRYETLPPKDAFAKQLLQDYPQISNLMADRQAFFQAHPIPQGANAIPYDAGPQASAYVQQQLNAKNYNDPQVQAYLNERTAYDNQKLKMLMLSPVNSYGQLPFQVASANASYARRQMRRNLRYAGKKINQEFNKPIKIASAFGGKEHSKGKKGFHVKIASPKLSKMALKDPTKIKLPGSKNSLKSFHIV